MSTWFLIVEVEDLNLFVYFGVGQVAQEIDDRLVVIMRGNDLEKFGGVDLSRSVLPFGVGGTLGQPRPAAMVRRCFS